MGGTEVDGYERLEDLARRPTIGMVAARAGVSRQTVSNAVNAPSRLRPETLAAVQVAIDELGYRPNQAARTLRTQATRVIGCRLLPSNYGGTGGVLDRLLHALCDTARSNGYDLLTFSTRDDDDEIEVYDDLLRRHAVDGFVLTNTHHGDARPDWLLERGARFVAFGRPWGRRGAQHSWIDVDGAKGTAAAVSHLAALGHTRIGFLGWPPGIGVADDRLAGWERQSTQFGFNTRGLLAQAEDGIASGRALAEELLSSSRPPTALVCVSDAIAIGALRAIEDRGWQAGQEVSVVGFDDSPVASVIRPGLSSLRQPVEAVANQLVETLLTVISGAPARPVRTLLAPRLVVRDSSGERRHRSPGVTASILKRQSQPGTMRPGTTRKEELA